jgi:protein O-mannosyl-transferase
MDRKLMKAITTIFIIVIVGTLSLLSYERNKVWQTELSLMSDTVSKSPNKMRPNINLATAYLVEKNYQKGLEYGLRALKIGDEYYIYYNLSIAYEGLGDLDSAYAMARWAVKMTKDPTTMTQLGLILQKMGYKTDGKTLTKETR